MYVYVYTFHICVKRIAFTRPKAGMANQQKHASNTDHATPRGETGSARGCAKPTRKSNLLVPGSPRGIIRSGNTILARLTGIVRDTWVDSQDRSRLARFHDTTPAVSRSCEASTAANQ